MKPNVRFGHHWASQRIVTWSVPSHYLDQFWQTSVAFENKIRHTRDTRKCVWKFHLKVVAICPGLIELISAPYRIKLKEILHIGKWKSSQCALISSNSIPLYIHIYSDELSILKFWKVSELIFRKYINLLSFLFQSDLPRQVIIQWGGDWSGTALLARCCCLTTQTKLLSWPGNQYARNN